MLSDSFTSVCNVSTATTTLIKEDWKSLTRREINHCRRKSLQILPSSLSFRIKRAEQNQSRGSIFFQHKSLPTRFDYHYRCLIIFFLFSVYLLVCSLSLYRLVSICISVYALYFLFLLLSTCFCCLFVFFLFPLMFRKLIFNRFDVDEFS